MRSLLIVMLILTAAISAQAAIYTVHPDGSGDYPTIQAAMYAANSGDVIQLGDGVFTGPGNRDLDTNETTFTVVSMSGNPDSCVINCEGSASNPHRGIDYSTQGPLAVLRGVSIINAYSSYSGGALNLANASITVENCSFKDNKSTLDGGAVYGNDWSSPVFRNCLFQSNIAYGNAGGAIRIVDNGNPLFQSCTFSGNSASNGGALSFELSCSAEINDCTLFNNSGSAVVLYTDCVLNMIQCIAAFNQTYAVTGHGTAVANLVCCDVFGNGSGNYVGVLSGQGNTAGNLQLDPQFCNTSLGNFALHSSSPCAAANNLDCGQIGAWPVGCWNIITVAADGSGDYPTIQEAVDAAVSGVDEVLLLDGIFTGAGNRNVDFLGKAITVRSASGNPAACIIDCNANENYIGQGFIFQNNEGPGSVLKDLTIREANDSFGGAILVDSSQPIIENCIFKNNIAGWGAGICVLNPGANPTVRNCLFADNGFSTSGGYGGAILVDSGSITLEGCRFIGNGKGSNPLYTHGGGLHLSTLSPIQVRNCTFTDNEAGEGGAIYVLDSPNGLSLVNCSIIGNSAEFGSALYSDINAAITINNSIIAFNQNSPWLDADNLFGPVSVGCSDIFGNAGGNWIGPVAGQEASPTNISLDPKFCDAANSDFTLESTSPCLPFTEPNRFCELVGAQPLGCDYRGVVTSIADVPNDQGRRVRVSWNASPQDAPEAPYSITGYSVWRLIDDPARKGVPAPEGQAERMNRFPDGDWDYITTVPARGESQYSVVCATLADSTVAGGLHLSTFFISAQTAVPTLFFDSVLASGYSVDNLAPSVPGNLRLQTPDLLAWDEVTTPDFNYFTAYGSQSDVLDGSAVQLGTTVGLTMDLEGAGYPYYLLTATDFSGNEGQPAVVASGITGVGDGPARPTRFALYPAWPNPGTGSTTFSFDLPQAAKVDLSVYDLAGRKVATLVSAEMPAGTHLVPWNGRVGSSTGPLASGVYFYRLQAGQFNDSGRVIILK